MHERCLSWNVSQLWGELARPAALSKQGHKQAHRPLPQQPIKKSTPVPLRRLVLLRFPVAMTRSKADIEVYATLVQYHAKCTLRFKFWTGACMGSRVGI